MTTQHPVVTRLCRTAPVMLYRQNNPAHSRAKTYIEYSVYGWRLDNQGLYNPKTKVRAYMTGLEYLFVSALMANLGVAIMWGDIYDHIYWDTPLDRWPNVKMIDVKLCKIRSILIPTPFFIMRQHGRGIALQHKDHYIVPKNPTKLELVGLKWANLVEENMNETV